MRKLTWLMVFFGATLGLLYASYTLVEAARFFLEHGRELRVKVADEYPGYSGRRTFLANSAFGEVVLETNAEIIPHGEYRVLFLTRGKVGDRRGGWLLPSLNLIRIKPSEPGDQFSTPIRRIELFDRFTVFMWGYVAEGNAPKIPAYSPESGVPWIFYEESVVGLLLENTPWYVWVGLMVWGAFCWATFGLFLRNSWSNRSLSDEKHFLHPALRHIEADIPQRTPPIPFTPSPKEIYPEAEVVDQPIKLVRSLSKKNPPPENG